MATIARTSAANIATGKKIYASDINAELNQLVNESNSKETRVTDLETDVTTVLSGPWTKTGTATFSAAFNVDGAADFDGTVNIDGALTATSTATFSGATSVTGTLTTAGVKRTITELDNTDSPYTVVAGDHYINCDATSGAITVTLPAASAGRVLVITKTDSSTNFVTISGTVSGETNPKLYTQNESIVLFASSSNWYAEGGLPKRQLIQKQSASTSSTINFTKGIDSKFRDYLLEIRSLKAGINQVQVLLRTSTDGGSSYDSGASDYRVSTYTPTGEVVAVGLAIALVNYAGSSGGFLGNEADESFDGEVLFYNPSGTSYQKRVKINSNWLDTGGNSEHLEGVGERNSTADIDAFQVYLSSGTITSGDFYLYGIR